MFLRRISMFLKGVGSAESTNGANNQSEAGNASQETKAPARERKQKAPSNGSTSGHASGIDKATHGVHVTGVLIATVCIAASAAMIQVKHVVETYEFLYSTPRHDSQVEAPAPVTPVPTPQATIAAPSPDEEAMKTLVWHYYVASQLRTSDSQRAQTEVSRDDAAKVFVLIVDENGRLLNTMHFDVSKTAKPGSHNKVATDSSEASSFVHRPYYQSLKWFA